MRSYPAALCFYEGGFPHSPDLLGDNRAFACVNACLTA